jgi:hypothetical protein
MSSIELPLEMAGAVKRELRGVEKALGQAKNAGESSKEGREALLQVIKKTSKLIHAAEELGDAAKEIQGS